MALRFAEFGGQHMLSQGASTAGISAATSGLSISSDIQDLTLRTALTCRTSPATLCRRFSLGIADFPNKPTRLRFVSAIAISGQLIQNNPWFPGQGAGPEGGMPEDQVDPRPWSRCTHFDLCDEGRP
jgi:hypothetical protein